jgi:hypothetical protein
MAAKLTRLTHKIAIHLHLVAERCTICSSRSRRPVWKLLDTPSYSPKQKEFYVYMALLSGAGVWVGGANMYRKTSVLRIGVMGCSEHGSETSVSVRGEEFIDYIKVYPPFEENSVPWSLLWFKIFSHRLCSQVSDVPCYY